MTTSPEPPRQRASWAPRALLVFAIAATGLVAMAWIQLSWMRATLSAQSRGLERIEQGVRSLDERVALAEAAVQQLRIEQSSSKKGISGVLEQIASWAEVLCQSTYTDAHYQHAEKSMREALRAVQAFGETAYQPIYDAILATKGGCEEEHRRWLLEAATLADPRRGQDLAVRMLRGYDPELRVSQRMRWLAADRLLAMDKAAAAVELRNILLSETSRGPDPNHPDPRSSGIAVQGARSGFHNFVAKYLEADDPMQEEILIQVLGKPGHDMITKQECVKELGAMGSRQAVKFIQRLYENPPEIHNNAIFMNHCINALVAILGNEACPWLQEQYSKAQNPLVADNIREKLKELGCG